MGCLSGLAALLALAIPLSIARASLPAALVLIALFAAAGIAGAYRIRRPAWYLRIVVLAVLYAGVVVAVHVLR